jgi:chorismate mutase / prephenate dehydratase
MNITDHRKAIDQLDAQIVKLLNDRTRHVLDIGDIKVKAGEEIYVPHRERAVLSRLAKINEGPLTQNSLEAIYREIMSSALALEKTMVIAYLGPEATFTHQAAIQRTRPSPTSFRKSARAGRITAWYRWKTRPRAWSATPWTCLWRAT